MRRFHFLFAAAAPADERKKEENNVELFKLFKNKEKGNYYGGERRERAIKFSS